MNKPLSSESIKKLLISYLIPLIKKEQAYYRIIAVLDKNIIHFQINGKSTSLKMPAEKIMRDNLLFGFSRAEIALITHLGTKNEIEHHSQYPKSSTFRITKELFIDNERKFFLESLEGEQLSLSAIDLIGNEEMIKQFDGRDGVKLGYALAEEYYKKLGEIKKSMG
jgi:hypothetical protein